MTTSPTIGPTMNPEQYAGVVEQRFRNIEGQVTDLKSSLSTQIAGLAAKMDERSKPQWQLMVSAIGVMMTILIALGGLIYLPIKNDQLKNETEITRLRELSQTRKESDERYARMADGVEKLTSGLGKLRDTTMSREEIDQRFATYGSKRDDNEKNVKERIDRLQKDVDQDSKVMVPRGEHERVWRSYEDRDKDLQRQLDEVKRSFENTFNLRDALQSMQKRIDSLEGQIPTGKR